MLRNYTTKEKDVVRKAIRGTISRLSFKMERHPLILLWKSWSEIQADHQKELESNILVTQFLSDVAENKAKTWQSYQQAYSDAIATMGAMKGRPTPLGQHNGGVNPKERLKMFYAQPQHDKPRWKALPLWSCKSDKEKIQMIMKADCPATVKAELLAANIAA